MPESENNTFTTAPVAANATVLPLKDSPTPTSVPKASQKPAQAVVAIKTELVRRLVVDQKEVKRGGTIKIKVENGDKAELITFLLVERNGKVHPIQNYVRSPFEIEYKVPNTFLFQAGEYTIRASSSKFVSALTTVIKVTK